MNGKKTCTDCTHYHACSMWAIRPIDHTRANSCENYESPKDCIAYFRGFNDGSTLVADCLKAQKREEEE